MFYRLSRTLLKWAKQARALEDRTINSRYKFIFFIVSNLKISAKNGEQGTFTFELKLKQLFRPCSLSFFIRFCLTEPPHNIISKRKFWVSFVSAYFPFSLSMLSLSPLSFSPLWVLFQEKVSALDNWILRSFDDGCRTEYSTRARTFCCRCEGTFVEVFFFMNFLEYKSFNSAFTLQNVVCHYVAEINYFLTRYRCFA